MKQHQLILTLPLKEVRCKLRYELRWGALRGQIKAQIPLAEGGEVLWIQPDQQPPLLLILQHCGTGPCGGRPADRGEVRRGDGK